METSNSNPTNPSSSTTTTLFNQSPFFRFLQSPVSYLLEYSGFLTTRPEYPYSETNQGNHVTNTSELSIRIIGSEQDINSSSENGVDLQESNINNSVSNGNDDDDSNNGETNSSSSSTLSSYQRYDIQQVARWAEQILPFSLLLLVVFIREHLQGFCVAIYTTAILFKSNDILQKQTALKGERKLPVLVGYSVVFLLHIAGVYWWHHKDEIFCPLLMIPPKEIQPFWRVIFKILINDTMVRQASMVLKLILLMYYSNGRGHNFRTQSQMLTLVEYTLLLYRSLLPAPVWYRFFLNKEYGSIFSSLTTGLYLTIKLTSVVEKVRLFFTALKALSKKDIHYGSYATPEQVNVAGDLCAICQEKMHSPILLRCKHIFCEDCVSEWFERERTCPLCRSLVRPADLRSYGDGSTNLFFQLF